MGIQRLFAAVMLFLALPGLAFGQTAAGPRVGDDGARIERLGRLAAVWGQIRELHPALAYRKIDWDAALIAAIPKVEAARSPADLAQALNAMFAVLGDPETRAWATIETPETSAQAPPTAGRPFRRDHDLVVADLEAIAQKVPFDKQGVYPPSVCIELTKMGLADVLKPDAAGRPATGLIIDARVGRSSREMVNLQSWVLLELVVGCFIAEDVTTGALRYREHVGFPHQERIKGLRKISGDSALVVGSSDVVPVYGSFVEYLVQNRLPPLAVVVTKGFEPPEFLAGLRAARQARVILVDHPETGGFFEPMDGGPGVTVVARTFEVVGPDGVIDALSDAVVAPSTAWDEVRDTAARLVTAPWANPTAPVRHPLVSLPFADKDIGDRETLPSREERILALFRLWATLDSFYPHKEGMAKPWDGVLAEYLPKFEAVETRKAYEELLMDFAVGLQDGHAKLDGTRHLLFDLGHSPRLRTDNIEGQLTVVQVTGNDIAVRVGDVITAIDGRPVAEHRREREQFAAASTAAFRARRIDQELLFGQKDTAVRLTLQGATGGARDVVLKRDTFGGKLDRFGRRPHGVVEKLPSGFGYVDLTRLDLDGIDPLFVQLADSPAIIFDMRGYPNLTGHDLASRLFKRDGRRGPWGMTVYPRLSPVKDRRDVVEFHAVAASDAPAYRGRVVVLINESAISQAENLCLELAAATDVVFVGTATAGTSGSVTNVMLPGKITFTFTGEDFRLADGRPFQRVGVQPSVVVAPTIKGIREGRDEVLAAAVAYLTTGAGK